MSSLSLLRVKNLPHEQREIALHFLYDKNAMEKVYSSLFVGILIGGIFYSGFEFERTVTHVFQDGP